MGQHDERFKVESQQNTKWFVDSCWTFAYRHSASGAPLGGCYQALVDGIKDGHRVKVLVKENDYDILIEPTIADVKSSYASAAYINEVSNNGDIGRIKANTTRVWRYVDTNGKHIYQSTIVGGSFVDENIRNNKEMIWFLDTQSWKNVINIDNYGNYSLGQKSDLVAAVSEGASVRYGFVVSTYNYAVFWEADRLHVNQDEITAMSVIGQYHCYFFGGMPCWEFFSLSTAPNYYWYIWIHGTHMLKARVHVPTQYTTKWFVSF